MKTVECPSCGKAMQCPDGLRDGQHVSCPWCGQKMSLHKDGRVDVIIGCPSCGGGILIDTANVAPSFICPHCGKKIEMDNPDKETCKASGASLRERYMRFLDASYWTLEGRSIGKEYLGTFLSLLYVQLLLIVLSLVALFLSFGFLAFIFLLLLPVCILSHIIVLIPVTVRRLHDLNLTGMLYILVLIAGLIPFVGWAVSLGVVIYLSCADGTHGPNRYGKDPLGREPKVPLKNNQRETSGPNNVNPTVEDRLHKLKSMLDANIIDEQEYKSQRAKIIQDL